MGRRLPGRGTFKTITVTSPAAGAEWTKTVPAGVTWRVMSVTFQLVTSATVANRQVDLQQKDAAANVVASMPWAVTQAASLTGKYQALVNQQQDTAFSVNRTAVHPISPDMVLNENDVIGTLTGNIQAADQYSAIFLRVEEF